jgi:hypothetical protein
VSTQGVVTPDPIMKHLAPFIADGQMPVPTALLSCQFGLDPGFMQLLTRLLDPQAERESLHNLESPQQATLTVKLFLVRV